MAKQNQTSIIHFRISPEEKAAIQQAATSAGVTPSHWIKTTLRRAVNPKSATRNGDDLIDICKRTIADIQNLAQRGL